ncbi:sugar nucleotide-binding protein [Roseburia faecis]|uniref:sugar nucleotide-binding protein n=1 Tax=Roseburia faecis TaxID=301302 RepID=UPI003F982A43
MKILIIGSGGMLGHILTIYLKEKGYDVDNISKKFRCTDDTICFDVLDEKKMKEFLQQRKYNVVVNCVALLVKESEANKTLAVKLNSVFPHWLEDFYSNTDTRIIQVSTAGVYYGDNAPYSEESRHDAISFYGKTKSLGELDNKKDLTVRSDFWGPDMKADGSGLFNWAMKQKDKVTGFDKVYINGVTSLEFAKFVDYIIKKPLSGTINLYSIDILSKAELIRKIYGIMGRNIVVNDNSKIRRNTSIFSDRTECRYISKSYEQQLLELSQWIENHKNLYMHYYLE